MLCYFGFHGCSAILDLIGGYMRHFVNKCSGCANQTLWLCEHLIFLVAGCCVDVLAAIYVLLQ